MSVRLLLTDEAWAEIAPILATIKSRAGSPPALSDRMFIEAVLYLARTGTALARPARGFWALGRGLQPLSPLGSARYLAPKLWEHLQAEDCPMRPCHLFIDATIVRAHQHAAGALKKTVAKPHRLWAALGAACPPKSMLAVSMNAPASLSS